MENLETALEPEGTRKKLKRELRAEAMTRLEEAARTEADLLGQAGRKPGTQGAVS